MPFPLTPATNDLYTAPSGAVYIYASYGAWKLNNGQTDFANLSALDKANIAAALQYAGSPIWHNANDGTTSGLDADLLDGQDGTYYTNIAARLGYTPFNAAHIPTGTRMPFQQTSAPTGWTKSTSHNDKAMRVVSGTVSNGGSTAFTTVFASRTIAITNLPVHQHSISNNTTGHGSVVTGGTNASLVNGVTGSGVSFTTATAVNTLTTAGSVDTLVCDTTFTGSGTAMDFAVQYLDFMVAVKD